MPAQHGTASPEPSSSHDSEHGTLPPIRQTSLSASPPPPPPPSSNTSHAPQPPQHQQQPQHTMNYSTTFPTTTDAWLSSRPTVSPLKTSDEGAYVRLSSSSSASSYHRSGPDYAVSSALNTPRGSWISNTSSGSDRRPSGGSGYAPFSPQGYSSGGTTPLSAGPGASSSMSPQDEWSPASYAAQGYGQQLSAQHGGLSLHGGGHHHSHGLQMHSHHPTSQYPAAIPLNSHHHHHLPPPSIPMPVPLGGAPPRRRGKLPKQTTEYLKDWLHKHADHPYPSEDEKKRLCAATGLSMSQVSNWMINARRRILAPARANATPATTTTPFSSSAPPAPVPQSSVPPLNNVVGPRPNSGDSGSTRSSRAPSTDFGPSASLYNSFASQGPPPPQQQHQQHSPNSASPAQRYVLPGNDVGGYSYSTGPASSALDGGRGSPHSTVSDHTTQ